MQRCRFRWAVCQLDALRRCFPSGIRHALNELPKSLDETYDRILLGIAEERQEYAQRLFRCLAESIRPLCVEELAEVLAIRFDAGEVPNYNVNWRLQNAEEAVLSACSSLITIVDADTSRIVQFSHFSVKEYLTSGRLANAEKHISQYHIVPHSAHTTLAQASLSVLLALDDQIDKERMKDFPLAVYAAHYWVDHAQFEDVCSRIKVAMEQLFDPAEPHFSAWVWIYDIDHRFREMMFDARPTRPEAAPLYYATLCGFRDLVEHLIVTYPRDIHAMGGVHVTALHTAIVKGNIEIMKLLLDHGADVAVLGCEDFTPLREASRRGRLDMMILLLERHADVNTQDMYGWTPLTAASVEGDLEVVQVLLHHGAAVDFCDSDGWAALNSASRHGHLDITRLLLQNGAGVDSRTNGGWTPLATASRRGHLDVVRLLLQHGAGVDTRNNDGWTPLAIAAQDGHLDVIRLLLQHGSGVDVRNNDGWTPLAIASQDGHLDVIRLLLQSGAGMGSLTNRGNTPLAIASRDGHLDVIRLLLQHGSGVDTRNNDGWTPLAIASRDGHLDVIRLLLQNDASVDSRSNHGWTPLAIASERGHVDIARLFLQGGAAVNASPNNGWSLSTGMSSLLLLYCAAISSSPIISKSRNQRLFYTSSPGIR